MRGFLTILTALVCVMEFVAATSADHSETTSTPPVTTIPSAHTSTCPAVASCRQHPNCTACLAALGDTTGVWTPAEYDAIYQGTTAEIAAAQRSVYTALMTTPCRVGTATLITATLTETGVRSLSPGCMGALGFTGGYCAPALSTCIADPRCRICLAALFTAKNNSSDARPAATALDSAACHGMVIDSNSPAGLSLSNAAVQCKESLPLCSLVKAQCEQFPTCASALGALARGDAATAAQLCPNTDGSAALLNSVVFQCSGGTPTSCDFFLQRCSNTNGCQSCWQALQAADSSVALGQAWLSPACHVAATDTPSETSVTIDTLYEVCPIAVIQGKNEAVTCLTQSARCAACLVEGANRTSGCSAILDQFGLIQEAVSNPGGAMYSKAVHRINSIVIATSVVGGVSVAACLLVISAITAHRHSANSIRDRIVVGMMLANVVYSIGSCIPVNLLSAQSNSETYHLPTDTVRIGRAWWFGGKYSLVCFELYIIAASLRALVAGVGGVRPWVEAALHVACSLVGAAAFTAFFLESQEIQAGGYNSATEEESMSAAWAHFSPDDDVNDDGWTVGAEAGARFTHGRQRYDALVSTMLWVFNGLLGVTVLAWAGLRLAYRRAVRRWRLKADAIVHEEEQDVWRETRRSEWASRLQLAELQREGYVEIAAPLQPYVLVFLLFGIPAVVMSTNYCQAKSGAVISELALGASGTERNVTFGECSVWCEFALAFRSLGAVAVYLLQPDRRAECFRLPTLARKLWARVRQLGSRGEDRRAAVYEINALADALSADVGGTATSSLGAVGGTNDGDVWVIDDADTTLLRKLGDGAYGEVWEATWRGKPVAIKLLTACMVDEDGDPIDPHAEEEFVKECTALRMVHHPNLLAFHGHGKTAQGQGFIVTELMPGGALEDALLDTGRDMSWRERISYAVQTASGLAHLHAIPLIHRDVKSANVLLDGTGRAAVGDFGTSRGLRPQSNRVIVVSAFTGTTRVVSVGPSEVADVSGEPSSIGTLSVDIVDRRGTMTKAAGTLAWMAPEVFRGDTQYGAAADVYSFGVVLWEIATRESPWASLACENELDFFDQLNGALQSNRRPDVPAPVAQQQPAFLQVMEQCWAGDPADRPTFAAIVPRLAACLRSECVNRPSLTVTG
eukprot:m.139478 g.139478  ORF g.139478 m.139478 type:complete len:1141 (-) comp14018_c0_seq2:130-3552(-)